MPTDAEERQPAARQRKRPSKKKRKSAAGPRAGSAALDKNKKAKAEEQEKELIEKRAQAAKEYLQLWALREEGGEWRFQKKRQVWILKHMYNETAIDKKIFKKYVLPYVGSLQGGAKERILAEAKAHLENKTDKKDREDEEEEEEVVVAQEGATNEETEKRAKRIVEILQED